MNIIKTTTELSQFCDYAYNFDYITIDTEFLRERTYYPKLCLIQLAIPSDREDSAVLIDPLEGNLDLSPLYKLFSNSDIVKVFHAARQDLEIFFKWHRKIQDRKNDDFFFAETIFWQDVGGTPSRLIFGFVIG